MRPFRRDGEAYVAHLEPAERAVLLDAVDDVVALLAADHAPGAADFPRMAPGPLPPPADPAVRRLLPDASTDREIAAELRRLTEQDLRATKAGHLGRLRAGLLAADPDLVVAPDDAAAVAAAFTDVRLVLAERLGVRDDEDSDALHALVLAGDDGTGDVDDGLRLLATLHVVLGVLQESLVELMLARLDEGPALGSAP